MPYIKQELRPKILEAVHALNKEVRSEGELNYAITCLCHLYAKRQINYANLNTIIGVLECAKAEFFRQVVDGYEDGKMMENGTVTTEESC